MWAGGCAPIHGGPAPTARRTSSSPPRHRSPRPTLPDAPHPDAAPRASTPTSHRVPAHHAPARRGLGWRYRGRGGRAVCYLNYAEPGLLSGIRGAGAVASPRGRRWVGSRAAVYPARGVRAAERGGGVDQRRAGGVRAPRGRREGDQAGADADVQRRLAAAGEGRSADPLAAHPAFLWWDARLQPRFGTIEVRIMDAQTTIADSAALTALVQCLVRLEASEGSHVDPRIDLPEVLAENRFLAARDGAEASLIDARRGCRTPVVEVLEAMLELCRPHAEDLGCLEELQWTAQPRRYAAADASARPRARPGQAAGPRRGTLRPVLSDTYGHACPDPARLARERRRRRRADRRDRSRPARPARHLARGRRSVG